MGGVVNPDLSHSPTQTFEGTHAGVLLGTAPYMSPEQVRGTLLDKRTDIWAFGCVLTEMLSGRRVFAGDTVPDAIAAILGREPDWNLLPAGTPLAVRRLLQRCLEKDVKQRLRDIGDVPADIDQMLADLQSGTSGVVSFDAPAARSRPGRRLVAIAIVALLAVTALAAGIWRISWSRGSEPLSASRSDWTQLTNFPDSVGQPSLSPDGRMLTFIRGPNSFTTSGQVYVKMLPDGEPKQLTNDTMTKMSPVFSPDGSRIAYTTSNAHNEWDTWVVPVLGGEPRRWLPNASGLIWTGRQKLLFSEKIRGSEGNHMKVVAADESRADARDLYVPMPKGAMAHRSYPSPDGRWALVAEMTDRGAWTPCRLVPMNASSPGRHVGPPDADVLVCRLVSRRRMDVFQLERRQRVSHVAPAFLGGRYARAARASHLRTDRRGRPRHRAGRPIVHHRRRHEATVRLGARLEGRARRLARRLRTEPDVHARRQEARLLRVRQRVIASGRVVDRRSGHGSQRASAARLFGRDRRHRPRRDRRSTFRTTASGWSSKRSTRAGRAGSGWRRSTVARRRARSRTSRGTRRCSIQTATSCSAPAIETMALRTVSARTAPACRKSTSTR